MKEKKLSSFKNNIKPSMEATIFYFICIIHFYSSKNVVMVVHVYSCLFTRIILVQIHTGILTWNGTGIFMNIHVYSSLFMFLEFQKSRVQLTE